MLPELLRVAAWGESFSVQSAPVFEENQQDPFSVQEQMTVATKHLGLRQRWLTLIAFGCGLVPYHAFGQQGSVEAGQAKSVT
ncbi:MAG TPA: hypothetical protein VJA26_07455, partial [Gammaproteobacteria bacterium]|nr:hypothetical protein [Gammaproteobacteria bacterium]